MIYDKRYLLKLGTARVPVWLRHINNVLDASELTTESNREHIERHDVAECVLETVKPVAFDLSAEIAQTGRFVIIDNYQIAGGGVILDAAPGQGGLIEEYVSQREKAWRRSRITPALRGLRHGQRSTLVIINGPADTGKADIAFQLEERLFNEGRQVYYLGVDNSLLAIGGQSGADNLRDEYIRRLGETSHLFTDAGFILITTISNLEDYELNILKTLTSPGDYLVVSVDDHNLSDDFVDLIIDSKKEKAVSVAQIIYLLTKRQYLPDYSI
ncbi:MAG: adenylyl-sulfate kinase [Candidatus Gastranaerophilales bacterium]|nr:adenylyl-sulfate kinase [Candidatus Gastranaerophilales bacterium]